MNMIIYTYMEIFFINYMYNFVIIYNCKINFNGLSLLI